jgi:hypothetical protein
MRVNYSVYQEISVASEFSHSLTTKWPKNLPQKHNSDGRNVPQAVEDNTGTRARSS